MHTVESLCLLDISRQEVVLVPEHGRFLEYSINKGLFASSFSTLLNIVVQKED